MGDIYLVEQKTTNTSPNLSSSRRKPRMTKEEKQKKKKKESSSEDDSDQSEGVSNIHFEVFILLTILSFFYK